MTSPDGADGRPTIVVAEDDGGNRLALLAVLEPLAEKVVALESGEATLKYLLQNADCAAVILDVQMGGIGGFEVARLLRERERTRNIPIIFLTGAMRDSAAEGYAEGAVDFMTKPFDPDTLRARVAALMRMHRARRTLEQERDHSLRQVRTARAETETERGYLYAFLQQVPALIARLRGPRHVFEFANASYIEAIGNRDPVGKEAREALPELEGGPFFALLDEVFASGIAHRANEVAVPLARGPDGAIETIYLNFVYQPTRNSAGVVDGILVHAVDVTVQVISRQAAEAIAFQLESAAAEARKLSTFQQQLLAVVGHDLRNPLNAISASAELMLRKPGDPGLSLTAAPRVARSAIRMKHIINDLVDFTQARLHGGVTLIRETCNIVDLCKQVLDELATVYPNRAMTLEAGAEVTGEWDCSRLQQVISNLVANGLQYSAPDSGIRVRVKDQASEVVVEVENVGSPIPVELMGRLFDPFQRGAQGGRANMGLGLYIVDQVVRAHGGSVEVSSTETTGTTFTVRLPRAA